MSPLTRISARKAITAAALAMFGSAGNAQTVPGFEVTTYALMDGPVGLSFAPDGTLYVGRDPVVGGSATPHKIYRVGRGGLPVEEYGDDPIPDPDVVLHDPVGVISGTPGSVLVGGLVPPGNTNGRISAILPDGAVETVFESDQFDNPIDMAFDSVGRFLFTEGVGHSVFVSEAGETPTLLFTYPGAVNCPALLTIDDRDRIYTCACDGIVRIHDADGSLINGNLADVGNLSSIQFGPGGAFGEQLYALDSVAGTLVRVDETGAITPVGTGFTESAQYLAFGPDGALYVSRRFADEVLRITPIDCPADLNQDGQVDGADLGQLLLVWNSANAAADLSGDGIVNGADLGILLLAWGPC